MNQTDQMAALAERLLHEIDAIARMAAVLVPYLSGAGPDDAEPFDVAWMNSVGVGLTAGDAAVPFECEYVATIDQGVDPSADGYEPYFVGVALNAAQQTICIISDNDSGPWIDFPLRTKGDVRRLRVLGVQLK